MPPLTIQITSDATGIDSALARLQHTIDSRMSEVEQRFQRTASATQQFSRQTQQHLESINTSIQQLQQSFSTLLSAFAAGGVFSQFIQETAVLAARVETLNVVLVQVARNAGVTSKAAEDVRDRIKQLGITTSEASTIVTRFIQNNLDLRKALELSRVAQDAAVIANQNSSEALAGLLHGILTLQPEVIRTYGLIVNLQKAYEDYAKSLGRTAEQLSAHEKQQVALNEVIKAGASIAGTYEAALGTVGKQLTSLRRFVEEASTVIGNQYLPIFGKLIELATAALKAFQDLPPAIQTTIAALTGAAAAVGTLTVAISALIKIGAALGVGALFTGWGPVILAIGAAVAGVIALTKALNDLNRTDPEALRERSLAALDQRIKQTEQLIVIQERNLKAAEGSMAGSQVTPEQLQRIERLRLALDGLRKTREQLAVKAQEPIPAPRPEPPQPPDYTKTLQASANAAKAQEQIIEQSLKRQESLIAQSFDERRAQQDEFFAQQIRDAPGEADQINRARLDAERRLALEEATLLEQIRLDANDRILAANEDLARKETAAHAGKVEEIAKIEATLQVAYEEHGARQEQIFAKTAEVRRRITQQVLKEETDELIKQNDLLEKLRQENLNKFAAQTEEVRNRLDREQEQMLQSQLRGYENFVNRVAGLLEDVFTQLLDGTLNAVDFFKRLLISALASIASSVIAPFVASIGAQIAATLGNVLPQALGGIITQGVFGPAGAPAGGLPGLTGAAGTALQGAGLMQALGLGSIGNFLQLSIARFGAVLDDAAFGVNQWFSQLTGRPLGAVSGLTALGGLAGIGGGIYSALAAQGIGGRAGGAIGAAGGLTAVISGLGLIAPALGPIGLALAAIAPLLGNFIDTLGAPAGPRFAVGGLGGVGVGLAGGQLALTGDLTSQVLRNQRASLDSGAVQRELAQTTTNLITGMLTAINQVALEPGALLGPTQAALDQALSQALTINSSNARNLSRDVAEQTRFIGVQVASFFLEPLNQAARQLESAPLQEQLTRFGPTLSGMAQVFQTMNAQVDELSRVANTDVLRQLSRVRSRVEVFGAELVTLANQLSEGMVTGLTAQGAQAIEQLLSRNVLVQQLELPTVFQPRLQAAAQLQAGAQALGAAGLDFRGVQAQIERLFASVITDAFAVLRDASAEGIEPLLTLAQALPDAVAALNPQLALLKVSAQAVAQVYGPISQAIARFEAELRSTDETITFTAQRMSDLNTAIQDSGGRMDVLLPLWGQMAEAIQASAQASINAINKEAQAKIDALNESTAVQEEALRAQVAAQEDALRAQQTALDTWADATTQMINDWADAALTTANQLKDVNATLLGEMSPAAQQATLQAQKAALVNVINATGSPEAISELITVEQQLLALAKQSDDLALQAQTLAELQSIQVSLQAQLAANTGYTDPVLAQLAIAQVQADQLKVISDYQQQQTAVMSQQLEALRASETQELEALRARQEAKLEDIRAWQQEQVRVIQQQVVVQLQLIQQALEAIYRAQAAGLGLQAGGVVRLATGGLVPVRVEPGESVWSGMSPSQDRALAAMNTAFPRFASGGLVPGTGSGDIVPMWLSPGTRVVNRTATAAMGYQSGGVVAGAGMPQVAIHIQQLTVRNEADIKAIIDGIARQLRREFRSPNNQDPWR